MAEKSVEVIPIIQEAEIYPDDPNYDFPEGVKTLDQKAEYWFRKSVEEFDEFPGSPNSNWNRNGYDSTEYGGIPWESVKNRSVGNSDFETMWRKNHKTRISSFKSDNPDKNGYKVFRKVTGYYKVQIKNEKVLAKQRARMEQILQLIGRSEYGSIDPLTKRDATVPLENKDGKIEYYLLKDVSNPSLIGYDVLEAEEAPVIMTDTLIESQLKGHIFKLIVENGEIPSAYKGKDAIFPSIMRLGDSGEASAPVFKAMRVNIQETKGLIEGMIQELSELELSQVKEMAEEYEPEAIQFGDMGELELVSKEITLKALLTLPYENRETKVQLNKWRPPVDNMKRGEGWPVSDAGDYIIHITQDPLEIIFKSSNRGWANQSCEALYGGSYKKGCFDDFKVGNGICMVYRASDLLDAEGSLRVDRSKAIGRFMLRWGMGRDASGNHLGPRIGIERTCYSIREDGSSQKVGNAAWINSIGAGLISIFTKAGLWDFTNLTTPYVYGGYADTGGSSNKKIHYTNRAFGATEGAGMGEEQRVLDYNTQYDLSYNEQLRILRQDDDEVTLNLCQNPLVWNYERVIGQLMGKIYTLYEESNRQVLMQLLLGHDYANPELMLSALDTIEMIQPDYKNILMDENIPKMFVYHPRSSAVIHEKIVDIMGSEAKELYAQPASIYLSNHNLLDSESFIFAPETLWQPYVDELKGIVGVSKGLIQGGGEELSQAERDLLIEIQRGREIENENYVWETPLGEYQGDLMGLTKDNLQEMAADRGLSQSGNKSELVERIVAHERGYEVGETPSIYTRFAEWYLPVLQTWASRSTSQIELLDAMNAHPLGVGYWGSIELAFMLMNQPNIGQENFDWLLRYWIEATELMGEEDDSTQPLWDRYKQMRDGIVSLMTFSFSQEENYGWELFNGGCPSIKRTKNHVPRTTENLVLMLNYLYNLSFDELGWEEGGYEITNVKLDYIHKLYTGNKNTEEMKVFFDFIMSMNNPEEQAQYLPMLFLRSAKRSNPTKMGLELLPQSALPVIFDVLINNPYGEYYYDCVFVQYVGLTDGTDRGYGRYVKRLKRGSIADILIRNLSMATNTSSAFREEGIKVRKELSEEMAFNILTNIDVLENMSSLELIASKLPNSEDLFYVMEDIVLTHYLEDLYNPEGDKPFRSLSPEEFDDFEIIRTINDGLPPIKEMILGFAHNQYTPSEILERIVQKPRMDGKSVGYRRMFDYYGINGNILSDSEEQFEETILKQIAQNDGVRGRLLKYLYDNYSALHESLIMNPNIVEARLFERLAEAYPIKILNNNRITKRAYMRHLRKMVDTIKLTPTSEFDLSISGFWDSMRYILAGNYIKNNAERFISKVLEEPYTHNFVRAGRCRFGTGLPTASHNEPEGQNQSYTGSIIEYPQLPITGMIEGRPFTDKPYFLYRGLNVKGRGESPNFLIDEVGQHWYLRKGLTSILNEIKEINRSDNANALCVPESTIDDESESSNLPSSTSIYQNNNYDYAYDGVGLTSLMFILDSVYEPQDEDFERRVNENPSLTNLRNAGLSNKAYMRGINLEGSSNKIRDYLANNLASRLRTPIEREALSDLIDIFPDKTRFLFNSENPINIIEMVDEDGVSVIPNIEEFDKPSIRNLLRKLTDMTFENFIEQYERNYPSLLVQNILMYNLLTGYLNPSRLRAGTGGFQIVNGVYDLEEVFGWIPPEERLHIRNYDSNGRFNDRMSAFAVDFVFTLNDTRLDRFVNEVDETEIEIPEWRVQLTRDGENGLFRIFNAMYLNPKLDYNDWADILTIFTDAIETEGCVLFPLRNPENPRNAIDTVDRQWDRFSENIYCYDLDGRSGFSDVKSMTVKEIQKQFDESYPYLYSMFLLGNYTSQGLRPYTIERFREKWVERNGAKQDWEKLMWSNNISSEVQEIGKELVDLLIGLDMNEHGHLYDDNNEPTDEELAKYQRQKFVSTRRRINELFGGMGLYRQYLRILTPIIRQRMRRDGYRSNQIDTMLDFKKPPTQDKELINALFSNMIRGYKRYLEGGFDANMQLEWRDFLLMIYLLRVETPEGITGLPEPIRAQLLGIRDANLPLFIQALRYTQVREGEEFIE